MSTKNKHAVALGRKGGQAKSRRKAAAARMNGKKGGRPLKRALAVACLAFLFGLTLAGCGDSPLAPSSPREPAITRDLPNCTQLTFSETAATYTCTNPGGVPLPVACTIEGNVITCHVVHVP